MRRTVLSAAVSLALVASTAVATQTASSAAPQGSAAPAAPSTTSGATSTGDYVVLYEPGTSDAAARAAVTAAGGTVLDSNAEVGYALVSADDAGFSARAADAPGLVGAAADSRIGTAPADDVARAGLGAGERVGGAERAAADPAPLASPPRPARDAEPLADRQWDMTAIGATADGTHATQPGSEGVTVGVIDTGIDGSHPDIAENFDLAGSRNFVTDLPDVDGACEVASCVDPADVDENGHGTHVASTIASPLNGRGIGGVAPGVTLVNLRAGQDAGYFFLQPVLDALTFAADSGVDVVNMSFYVDPWLYNCRANPADSPQEQLEQRVTVAAVQRAITYARSKGVLPVSAAGNGATDLGAPGVDASSPNYPVDAEGEPAAARERTIDNSSCLVVPTELDGVVSVTSTGPSGRKAFYSDYGVEQADVAAPGGDTYDTPNQRANATAGILAAYPEAVARAEGAVDEDGEPTSPFTVKDCDEVTGECGYYEYLQGTSMAAPHAAGVAALVVSEHGVPDPERPGELTLDPALTERYLLGTATDTACPVPAEFTYRRVTATGPVLSSATCAGSADRNGFYGEGVVDAEAAVG